MIALALRIADGPLHEIVAFAASPQACGYFASLLVFVTFWMQRMVPLRVVAICSNLAFFAYAVRLGLMPIAVLHASLLPLNAWRLRQRLQPGPEQRSPASGRRLAMKGTSAAALSLLFVGAAGSDVADGGVHCRAERWRDWNAACRALAARAGSLADPPAPAQRPPPDPSAGDGQR